jgi:hypothetical protein
LHKLPFLIKLQCAFDTNFYLVGDASYTLSDEMLFPFVGSSQRDYPTKNALTFSFTAEDKNRNLGIWFSSEKMMWCLSQGEPIDKLGNVCTHS